MSDQVTEWRQLTSATVTAWLWSSTAKGKMSMCRPRHALHKQSDRRLWSHKTRPRGSDAQKGNWRRRNASLTLTNSVVLLPLVIFMRSSAMLLYFSFQWEWMSVSQTICEAPKRGKQSWVIFICSVSQIYRRRHTKLSFFLFFWVLYRTHRDFIEKK